MDVFQQQVSHRQYGIGTVIEQSESMIEVQFDGEYGNKKFLYPSAFESFLLLSSPASQEKMQQELQARQDALEAVQKQREEAFMQRHEHERRALLEQKRGARKKTGTKALAKKSSVESWEEAEERENAEKSEEE